MTAVEIILIVTGIILMIGSFFVTEKLSQKEIAEISQLSSVEMKRILEKNMEQAAIKTEELVDDVIDRSMEIADQALKRQTNLKIQDISEFTDTVLEAIRKNHSEVMFLYSMLNDKQGELRESAGNLEKLKSQLLSLEENVTNSINQAAESIQLMTEQARSPKLQEVLDFAEEEEPEPEEDYYELPNNNMNILELYRQGMPVTNIARELGLGVGEVKLVIDLYREEEA